MIQTKNESPDVCQCCEWRKEKRKNTEYEVLNLIQIGETLKNGIPLYACEECDGDLVSLSQHND